MGRWLSIVAVVAALALGGSVDATSTRGPSPEATVLLVIGVTPVQKQAVESRLAGQPGIVAVIPVDRAAEARATLGAFSGALNLTGILNQLNPEDFPDGFKFRFATRGDYDRAGASALPSDLRSMPGVQVLIAPAWPTH